MFGFFSSIRSLFANKNECQPFATLELLIAWRYLRSKRKEVYISIIALLSFIGIFVSVATLITVMGILNGFRQELLNGVLGSSGHVIVQSIDEPFASYTNVAEQLSSLRGVRAVAAYVQGQALVTTHNGATTGAGVRGITGADLSSIVSMFGQVDHGSLKEFDASSGIAIGEGFAARFGINIGDRLTLITPKGSVTPFGTAPRSKSYHVAAILSVALPYNDFMIMMPLKEAQFYFDSGNTVSALDIYLDNPDAVESMAGEIIQNIDNNLIATDWRSLNEEIFVTSEIQRNITFIVLGLIVLVAAINIASGLIMLAKDKGKDLAILRTMGISSGSIMRIFFMIGSSIGVAGTVAGVFVGLLLCWNVDIVLDFLFWMANSGDMSPETFYKLFEAQNIRAIVNGWELAAVIIMALTLSFLATIYPARRASRIEPVEALRYE